MFDLQCLFSSTLERKAYFKGQIDLVNGILSHPSSPYFESNKESADYSRAQSRMKAYISQIFSQTAKRSIGPDLELALRLVFTERLGQDAAHGAVDEILHELKIRNQQLQIVQDIEIVQSFVNDFKKANYVVSINAKPLITEIPSGFGALSLRVNLINELRGFLLDNSRSFKQYRLNYPLESTIRMFWTELIKIVTGILREPGMQLDWTSISHEVGNNLIANYSIPEKLAHGGDSIRSEAFKLLRFLNENRFIITFLNESPIYTLPIVAFNPASRDNLEIYSLHEHKYESEMIYRFSKEEKLLWRMFVWDNIKTKNRAGAMSFMDSIADFN